MTPQYPYNSPVVMTDAIFTLYGGRTGTSSSAQRDIAFTLAEEQMTEYLSSFLVPTTVTGTYFWRWENPISLDYGHVKSVNSVVFSSLDGDTSCSLTSTTGCSLIRNSEYGYVDVGASLDCSGCCTILGVYPYNVTIAYQSGLETGTSNQRAMLQALTIVSQINLNEIDLSLANESTGDIGIESFSNQ